MRKHSELAINGRGMEMVIDDQDVTDQECLLLDRNGTNIVQYCAQQGLEIVHMVAIKNDEPNEVEMDMERVDPATGESTGEVAKFVFQSPAQRDYDGEFGYVAFVIARRQTYQGKAPHDQYYEVGMSPQEYWQPCYLEDWVPVERKLH